LPIGIDALQAVQSSNKTIVKRTNHQIRHRNLVYMDVAEAPWTLGSQTVMFSFFLCEVYLTTKNKDSCIKQIALNKIQTKKS